MSMKKLLTEGYIAPQAIRATLEVGNIVECIYNGELRRFEIERLEEENDNVFGYQTQLGERQPRTFKIAKITHAMVVGKFEASGS